MVNAAKLIDELPLGHWPENRAETPEQSWQPKWESELKKVLKKL